MSNNASRRSFSGFTITGDPDIPPQNQIPQLPIIRSAYQNREGVSSAVGSRVEVAHPLKEDTMLSRREFVGSAALATLAGLAQAAPDKQSIGIILYSYGIRSRVDREAR